MFSDVVKLQCGVRQGGVLSPVLFAVYVNDVIMALSKSGHGCYFNNFTFTSVICSLWLIFVVMNLIS